MYDEEQVRHAGAKRAIRVVERYLYWALGRAEEGSKEARMVADEMRLAVGLRRKLDTRYDGPTQVTHRIKEDEDVCKGNTQGR
jgi:hypothetical protein